MSGSEAPVTNKISLEECLALTMLGVWRIGGDTYIASTLEGNVHLTLGTETGFAYIGVNVAGSKVAAYREALEHGGRIKARYDALRTPLEEYARMIILAWCEAELEDAERTRARRAMELRQRYLTPTPIPIAPWPVAPPLPGMRVLGRRHISGPRRFLGFVASAALVILLALLVIFVLTLIVSQIRW